MNLTDATARRQSELTQTLAGCATVNPALVVELVHKLRPADLIDEPARAFLLALKPDMNPAALALKLGLVREYMRWLGIGCDVLWTLPQVATEAVDGIKKLCIAREALTELSDWLIKAERTGGYTYVG